MYDLNNVNAATDALLAQGVRVLNAFLLGDTETDHAMRLLELMAPAQGAVVLDAGCGVGELALLMSKARPDLEFKLLNVSQHQLELCPQGMERICAPYERTGLPEASVDVVLFAFSLCHAEDWGAALREAYRVLRPGGVVFIFDMAREGGSNTMLREILHASAYRPMDIASVAKRCGLDLVDVNDARMHVPAKVPLADAWADREQYAAAMRGVFPFTMRLSRMPEADPIESAFARHDRIAFQFSGGRDSVAALFRLRPFWHRMTVYHLDTGDQFPETREVVQRVERMLPRRMVRIEGNVEAVREQFGLPSDVLPVDNTPIGRMVSGRATKLQSRYDCCARSLMNPMHARMVADGITLIVRGQRDDEYDAPPLRSGDVQGGIEVLYPVQDWSAERVMRYLKDNQLPLAPFYDAGMKRAPECMGCTAWWDEGRPAYLKQWHPVAFAAWRDRMGAVRGEINRQLAMLEA